MRKNCVRMILATAVLCLVRGAWGQSLGVVSLQGEVHGLTAPSGQATVELMDVEQNRTVASVDLEADGTFQFRQVPYGEYTIAVSHAGRQLMQDLVSVHGPTRPITLLLPEREGERPPEDSVSLAELLHPPTRKAEGAFRAARKYSDAGDFERAAQQLEKAVQLSPDYVEARVNLAAQYIYLGRYQQALHQLTETSRIARPTAKLLSNMAYAQLALRRGEAARESARGALQLEPANPKAHYMLGLALATDSRTLPQAIPQLEWAARSIPSARTNLERARRELALMAVETSQSARR